MTKKELRRDKYLQDNFHISLKEYKAILAFQGGGCAICKKKLNKKGIPLLLAVDHSHESALVRGILCWRCNKCIQIFEDNPVFLQAAADYLLLPPATIVLGKPRLAFAGRVGTKKYRKLIKAYKEALL